MEIEECCEHDGRWGNWKHPLDKHYKYVKWRWWAVGAHRNNQCRYHDWEKPDGVCDTPNTQRLIFLTENTAQMCRYKVKWHHDKNQHGLHDGTDPHAIHLRTHAHLARSFMETTIFLQRGDQAVCFDARQSPRFTPITSHFHAFEFCPCLRSCLSTWLQKYCICVKWPLALWILGFWVSDMDRRVLAASFSFVKYSLAWRGLSGITICRLQKQLPPTKQ